MNQIQKESNDVVSSIDDVKRYEHISKMLFYLNDQIINSFNLFLKVYSTIVGGIIWLSIQESSVRIKENISPIIPFMFGLIGIFSLVMIINNVRSWWGYRKAESILVGINNVPLPRFPKSCIGELSMLLIISVATIIGVLFIRP